MVIDNTIQDKDLLEACFQGNADAIAIFYERFKDLIYNAIHSWINKYAKDEDRVEDVKDIFQQAILELMDDGFKKLKQLRDPNKPTAIIFLISYQCAGRYFKAKWKEKKIRVDGPTVNWPSGEEGPIDGEVYAIVDSFLDTLNDMERTVFELRFKKEKKYEHIAFETGLSIDNIGVMISRIKDKFKVFVKDNYPDVKDLL